MRKVDVPTIQVAERPGTGLNGAPRPTEDRVVVLPNAVVVLDGVTSRRPASRNGGWYANQLGEEIGRRLAGEPSADLVAVLADSIEAVTRAHRLVPRDSPSSTVAILRWSESTVDALALADSPVVVFTPEPRVLADDQLARLRASGGDVVGLRNVEGGFWVAEADPSAARHAATASWPADQVRASLVATDGVACGVDDYGLFDWLAVLELAERSGPDAVLAEIRAAELADTDCRRWPRSKTHDDQTLAVIRFRP
ncbi:MAG: hypothetical protein JOZ47_09595 [Kutzneria sp.]|nr:hypothetical protein [Kutzneria sp.]